MSINGPPQSHTCSAGDKRGAMFFDAGGFQMSRPQEANASRRHPGSHLQLGSFQLPHTKRRVKQVTYRFRVIMSVSWSSTQLTKPDFS